MDKQEITGLEIAVVGMACKFPGASNINEFWENLKNGKESISRFSDDELREYGVQEKELSDPDYVKAKGLIEDAAFFDASFFGISPTEAAVLDPQFRVLLQCAYNALEDANYNFAEKNNTGVFVGGTPNFNWQMECFKKVGNLYSEQFSSLISNDKDFISTKLSYLLNLQGHSHTLYTACSTSLVAIDMACQSLLTGKCDVTLAGGVSLSLPYKSGYTRESGMIMSKDGHTRSFDVNATGTIWSDGVGTVVLKRLEDAIAHGDHIHAVIKGSATNNDGNRKVGYTAPSIKGQTDVIGKALKLAEVPRESIAYIEGHGSATSLGDKIEINALKEAFKNTDEDFSCSIGSVKANLGHLNVAAGVAGFIKVCLMLKNDTIPPVVNFETPNSQLKESNGTFFVNEAPVKWESSKFPLRAGINSFGIGGTNAHVILEKAPSSEQTKIHTDHSVICLSAKTPSALNKISKNLSDFVNKNKDIDVANFAYTLQTGRKHLKYRKAFVVKDTADLIKELAKERIIQEAKEFSDVVFMFPGMGGFYPKIGKDLYLKEPAFKNAMDGCFSVIKSKTGKDFKSIMYGDSTIEIPADFQSPQLMVFAFEYSLAMLLKSWGIVSNTTIGYSLGEYVAACVAGVFSLKDVLEILIERGRLINSLDTGGMFAIPLSKKEIEPHLKEGVSIAIDNGESVVVAGRKDPLQKLIDTLKKDAILILDILDKYAVHTTEMNPITEEFKNILSEYTINPPEIPMVSNVTGTWCSEAFVSPDYWIKHLSETVDFSKVIKTLSDKNDHAIYLEVGVGKYMGTLLSRSINPQDSLRHVSLSRSENRIKNDNEQLSDHTYLMKALASFWEYGGHIDWKAFCGDQKRNKLSLPTYPFEGSAYSLKIDNSFTGVTSTTNLERKEDVSSWFYVPSWKKKPLVLNNDQALQNDRNIVLFDFNDSEELCHALSKSKHHVIQVNYGDHYKKVTKNNYLLNYNKKEDVLKLFKDLESHDFALDSIIDLTSISDGTEATSLERTVTLFQCINQTKYAGEKLEYFAISDGLFQIYGNEKINPEKSGIISATKVIPQENPNISCRLIEVEKALYKTKNGRFYKFINDELNANDSIVSYRGEYRWSQIYEPYPIQNSESTNSYIKDKGTYIIVGGLGDVGFTIAQYILENFESNVVIVGRSKIPEKGEREEWIKKYGSHDAISKKIARINRLENGKGKVFAMQGDSTSYSQMKTVVEELKSKFGEVNGIFHAAGDVGSMSLNLVNNVAKDQLQDHLSSKSKGLSVLQKIVKNNTLDFTVILSSTSSILGGIGMIGYAAANQYVDSLVLKENANEGLTKWISINYTYLNKENVANEDSKQISSTEEEAGRKIFEKLFLKNSDTTNTSINFEESRKIFERLLSKNNNENQIIVSPIDFSALVEKLKSTNGKIKEEADIHKEVKGGRPITDVPYVAPTNDLERKLADIWEGVFGFEVGLKDDFFQLGGDSLGMIRLISNIQKEFDVSIEISEVFKDTGFSHQLNLIQNGSKRNIITINKASKKAYYVQSEVQKSFFILNKMNPDLLCYNNLGVITLEGNLDISLYENLFKALIQEHDILRTSFHVINGESVQKIHENVNFELEIFEDENEEIEALIQKFQRPFNLETPHLIRAAICKRKNNIFCVITDIHHIILDRVTFGLIIEDFQLLFSNKQLTSSKIKYVDFSEWQQSETFEKLLKKQEKFWLNQFKTIPEALTLPIDFQRSAVKNYNASSVIFELNDAENDKLWKICQKEKVTMNSLLLTMYYVLVSKLSNQEDIVIGTSVLGRQHEALEKVMGVFANALPIRNCIDKQESFKEFLHKVKNNAFQCFAHQEYPFERIVQKLGITPDLNQNPLFDVMFEYYNFPEPKIEIPNTRLLEIQLPNNTTEFDFCMRISSKDDGQHTFHLDYRTDLYKEETIARFASYYRSIIEAVTQNMDTKLSELNVLPANEQKLLIQDYNATEVSYEHHESLVTLFERQVSKNPQANAVVYEGVSLTYQELNEQSNQVAHYLMSQDVVPGTMVGLLLERSLDMLIGILGVLKAGGGYVPIDPELPEQRINYMLDHSRSSFLLTSAQYIEQYTAYLPVQVIDAAQIKRQNTSNLGIDLRSDDLAYCIFTSGSSGKPKGIMMNQRSVINLVKGLETVVYNTYKDQKIHVALLASFSFDASVQQIFGSLLQGHSLYIVDDESRKDGAKLRSFYNTNTIDLSDGTPTHLSLFVDGFNKGDSLTSLSSWILAGEVLSKELVSKFHALIGENVQLYNFYGPTETCVDSTAYKIDWNTIDQYDHIPIGKPLPNERVYVTDTNGKLVPIGVIGELCIAGDGLAQRYVGDESLTSKKFDSQWIDWEERVYRTGDLVKWLPDGNLAYQGRIDDQVKIRGYRIELGEIENVLKNHVGIDDVAMLVKEDDQNERNLAAYLVPSKTNASTIRRIIDKDNLDFEYDAELYEMENGVSMYSYNRSEIKMLHTEIFEHKTYHKNGIKIPKNATIIDIGANVGAFSIFSMITFENPKIYAFEPLSPIYGLLEKNVGLYAGDIEVFNVGISDKEEEAIFDYYPYATTLSGRHSENYNIHDEVKKFLDNTWETNEQQVANEQKDELLKTRLINEKHTCQLKSLSQIIKENAITHIDLLKIDAENAEMAIINGITEADWTKIDQIIIEVYDEDGRLNKIKEILANHNFETSVFQSKELEGTKFYDVYCIKEKEIIEGKIQEDYTKDHWYGSNALVKSVRKSLAEKLPDYMIPSDFILIEKMPLTTNGKLDRKALLVLEQNTSGNKVDFLAASNKTERRLVAIWSEVLNIEKEKIGVSTDFFDLGGHSLKMILLTNKIKKAFNVAISLKELIGHSTIQSLSHYLSEQDTTIHVPILPAPLADYYPLSSSQKRLYFLNEFDDNSITYNQPQCFILKGNFDREKFTKIYQQAIARHESLRTCFKLQDGEPVQYIEKVTSFEVEYFRSTMKKSDAIIANFVRPFDLEKAPLLRVGLIRISKEKHIMMFDMHHIISDGISMEIFIKDLMAFYQDKTLDPLALQYKDYAVWQQGEEQQEQLLVHKEFWNEQFSELPPALELPTNRARPKVINYQGNLLEFTLNPDQMQGLNAIAKASEVTLFSVVLAIYKVLLYKLTGEKDLIVGTSVAGRNHVDIENVMGVFINAIPLRNNIEGKNSFRDLIIKINENSLSSFEHQDYPYEALINDLNLVRDMGRNPLFDVMFEYVNFEQTPPLFPGLELVPYGYEYNVSKFDLTLHANEREDHIAMDFQYSTDLFDRSTIENFVTYFMRIVDQVTSDASIHLDTIGLMGTEELDALKKFNVSEVSFEVEQDIVSLFESNVNKYPSRTAIAFGGLALSYKELHERSNQVAAYLIDQKIKKGHLVGLIFDRSLDMIIGLLGVLKSGAAYVPIDPKLPFERINHLLESSGAKLLLGHEEYLENFNNIIAIHNIKNVFSETYSKDDLLIERSPSDLAYCIYTSGSTGIPKGVLMEHRSITNLVGGLSRTVYKGLEPGLRVGLLASYSFDASCQQIFGALLEGHSLFISSEEERMDGLSLYNFYKEHAIEISDGTSTHFGMFLSSFSGAIDLPDLKRWLLAGEALPKELVRDFYNRLDHENTLELYNLYGPTESCVDSTYYRIDPLRLDDYTTIPIGRPLPNERIHIVDSSGHAVPLGVQGELCIAGTGLARGYVDKENEKERFVSDWIAGEDRVYRTGDLARWLPDGNIEYLGRIDSQVKLRGYRIELGEIEHALLSHPAVIGGAVILTTITDEVYLSAYYVSEQDLDDGALREHLLQVLPEYMIPSFYVRLDTLPVTSNGKLNREALPSPDNSGIGSYKAPSTENEERLLMIWSEVLKRDPKDISVTQNFLELGGHSLKAIQIANKIKKEFGIEIRLAEIFQRPTIIEQAMFIDANQWLHEEEEELQQTDKIEIDI